MPEQFRAAIVIVALSLITFWIANKALKGNYSLKELKKWQSLWLVTFAGAVLVQNFWVFSILVLVGATVMLPTKSPERVYLYLLLICILPLKQLEIPGVAGIRYLFELDYARLMVIALLLPLFIFGQHNPKPFKLVTDKYVIGFIVLVSILEFRDNSITNAIRSSFLLFLDIYLPYYLISRHIKTSEDIKKAMVMLFIGLAPFALIGVFETLKHWFLYLRISESIFDVRGYNGYTDIRGGGIRASAVFVSPIILGYVMVIATGILLYIRSFSEQKRLINLALLAIVACLIATKSRGPWVGFAFLITVYLWTSPGGLKKVILLCMSGILSLPILNMTATGAKYINMLPIIGDTRADTIDYRSRLIENAWSVFQRNPLFGSTNFIESPEMESMRQGQGIIDLVNTYIQIALPYGMLGLLLFCSIFYTLLTGSYKSFRRFSGINENMHQLGKSFFATLLSMMFIIGTVSSIDYVPVFYWAIAGLAAAYITISHAEYIRHNKLS